MRGILELFLEQCKNDGYVITDNEVWKSLHDCLTCNDIRYLSYNDAIMLDVFIENEGIIRDNFTLTMPLPKINNEKCYYGKGDVQVKEKAVLTAILKSRGFMVEGYELNCIAGEADLIAHNVDGLTVIGEVGACRITKVFETLLTPPYVETFENMELWHLPYPTVRDEGKSKIVDCVVFTYKRGKNWERLYRVYEYARWEPFRTMISND